MSTDGQNLSVCLQCAHNGGGRAVVLGTKLDDRVATAFVAAAAAAAAAAADAAAAAAAGGGPAPPVNPDTDNDAVDGPRHGDLDPALPPASADDGSARARGRGELSRITVSPRLLALLYSL